MGTKTQAKITSVNVVKGVADEKEKLSSIRNLLFGEEVERLDAKIKEHYDFFNDRLNSLEKLIKSTSQKIEKEIRSATKEINQSLNVHNSEHLAQEDKLEQKIIDFNSRFKEFKNHTQKDLKETHHELDEVAKQIYNSLEKEVKKLTKKIDQTSKELSSNKADRKTLACLLESMANNLNDSKE
ncbi:hypothetical protein [Aliikangiella sp. G2MR2-5]|uniref:hypothetical protein n=1 Tax=Aliikangiella sp. G2MR2-5 TaxID=2788943 RepID=UPI0018A9CB83|nr:hypothetical protein [Aliikangiella sp. G2MR2-5]